MTDMKECGNGERRENNRWEGGQLKFLMEISVDFPNQSLAVASRQPWLGENEGRSTTPLVVSRWPRFLVSSRERGRERKSLTCAM